MPLDLARIPNFANLDPVYTTRRGIPGNAHSVCKNWGTTGWIYDTTPGDEPRSRPGPTSSPRRKERRAGRRSVLDTAPNLCGHLLLGQRHRLDDRGPGRPRRLRSVHGRRVRSAHHGVRLVPRHSVRAGQLRPLPGLERRRPSGPDLDRGVGRRPEPVHVGHRRPRDRAVDGQLVHRRGRGERRRRVRLHQLHPRPDELDHATSSSTATTRGWWTSTHCSRPTCEYKEMIFFTPEEVGRMKSGAVNSAQDRLVSILQQRQGQGRGLSRRDGDASPRPPTAADTQDRRQARSARSSCSPFHRGSGTWCSSPCRSCS